MDALIFDCDGVLVDTERDGHRVAFNQAFDQAGIAAQWSIGEYAVWLEVGGGKERMRAYFNENGWPEGRHDRDTLIKDLHTQKTSIFLKLIEGGQLPLRPGITRLIDEAIAAEIPIAVCSTSNERAVNGIVQQLLGKERAGKIRIFAGDMAQKKKPDPEIYNLAKKELSLDPARCVVVEDSRIGLLAAKAAGMHCIITRSAYTQSETFEEADLVLDHLDAFHGKSVELKDLRNYIKK